LSTPVDLQGRYQI